MTTLFAAGWRESKNSPWDMPHRISGMDESGAFWKSLKEKKTRCRGGKQAKQRVTVTFFVNAAGEKEPLIVIGTSKTPRCFRKLRDQSRPARCYYFANSKAWMQSELILQILNTRMKNAGRNIIRFLDNAPGHPRELINMFSNIKVAFRHTVPTCRSNQELEGEVQEEASPVCLQPDRTHQCPQKGKRYCQINRPSQGHRMDGTSVAKSRPTYYCEVLV